MTAFLFIGASTPMAMAEEWTFLPVTPLFDPLIADPLEPGTSVQAYLNETRYQGEVGVFCELLRLERPDHARWGWGLLGSGNILLGEKGVEFPMLANDWYAGMYLSESSGDLSFRLEFEHQSAHLGDSFAGSQDPIIYNGENFNLAFSLKPSENLRFFADTGYWENFFPMDNRFFASAGLEAYTSSFGFLGTSLRGYGAFNLRYKDELDVWNKTLQVGIRWKRSETESRAIRLALVYYDGNNQFGQLYTQPDQHWALGIYFDP